MNFILPGFSEYYEINKKLVLIYKSNPEYFIDGFNFGCFYGNPGFNIWNGGRISFNYPIVPKEKLEEMRDFYNGNGIPIRLIFTNTIIKEEHLYDGYGNLIMEVMHNGMNEVMVTSELLENYLRNTYPNYKYCSSTTKCLTDIDNLDKELQKEYHQVCLDYNLNHNFSYLDNIDESKKNKCEFLCNAICPPQCPRRKEHYKLNSLFHLNAGKLYTVECLIKGSTLNPKSLNYKNNISPKEIENVYNKKGFINFKLEGRTLDLGEFVMNLVRYCIKPECQYEVAHLLLD